MERDIEQHTPLRRVGQPEDVAEMILSAMTNRFLTGQVVMLEGGSSLLSGY